MIEISHPARRCGEHLAVSDLSFTINSGQICGFPGPNGAEKSTTINIITVCLSATEGSARIDGHDIFEEPGRVKRLIGCLPEQPPLICSPQWLQSAPAPGILNTRPLPSLL